MSSLLQLDDPAIANPNLVPLLARYQLIPNLLYESILDRAILPFSCTAEETTAACEQFYLQRGLNSAASQQEWRSHYGLSQIEVAQMVTRSLRIEKFKQETWGNKLQSYFLQRKDDLDQVIYSLLRTYDQNLAQELYFRISGGEQSFAELAQQYSEGAEAETGGLLGRVEVGTLHVKLAALLRTGAIGQVDTLFFGNWYMLVRLEKRIPAQLSDVMRQRLLQEQFEAWLLEQTRSLSRSDQVWLGISSQQASEMITG